jgi:uncharacterized protein
LSSELLERIKESEAYLRKKGFRDLRVRVHNNIARIEIPRKDFQKITEPSMMDEIINYFHELKFDYITLDLQGFRSGSMNEVLKDKKDG